MYKKHLDTYLNDVDPSTQGGLKRDDAIWKLVDAVDTEDEWKGAKGKGKVRKTLRKLVNRENPTPRELDYNPDGEPEGQPKEGENRKQPEGIFTRLTYFSPYLFCSQFYLKMGTICFAFVFHDSIFSVYKSLENPTLANWNQLSFTFMVIAFVIQVLFGVIVGLTFGTSTPDNVLTSAYAEGAVFPAENVFSQIIQVAFSVVLLLTYPACIVISREFVESIMMLYRKPAVIGGKPQEIARITQLILASILVLLTVPFLFFPSAGELAEQVLDLVGSCACGYMAFILPSIVYWKVYGRTPAKGETRSMTDTIMPYAVLLLGVYSCLIAPGLTIAEWTGVFSTEMPHPPALKPEM